MQWQNIMKTKIKKSIIRWTSLLLLLVITAGALSSCFLNNQPEPLYDKEELILSIESNRDFSGDYIYSYFVKWRFPRFDKSTLSSVEKTFRKNYVEELADPGTLALAMSECFFENFYSEIDLHNEDEMTLALIDCLIYTIGDKYAVYRTPKEFEDYDADMSGEIVGIGVQVMFNRLDNTCFIESVNSGSGAERAGILPGDYIIAVDGTLVSDMGYQKTISAVRGDVDTRVNITVLRGDKQLSFEVTRSVIKEQSVSYSINEEKIGYVKITGFKENTAEQFKEAIDYLESCGCVGVIYDLRSNPGGYLSAVVEMLSYIAPSDEKIVTFSNDYAPPVYDGDSHTYLIPSVVICNGYTASAGELFTSAIRDFGKMEHLESSIVGEQTYGKGIMQSTYTFLDGSTLTLTVAYYNPPSGENYHNVGIEPNVICDNMETALDDAYTEIYKLLK